MKIILLLLVSLQVFAKEPLTIAVMGDSITEGYGVQNDKSYIDLLKKDKNLSKKIHWIVDKVSGSVVASALSRWQILFKEHPEIKGLIIELGANDVLTGIKPKETEKSFMSLLNQVKLPILILDAPVPSNYGTFKEQYASMYARLDKEKKVSVLYDFLGPVVINKKLVTSDGIHPNEAGHKKLSEKLLSYLPQWVESL
jgi:acyl-CoA thioesterase-1